MATVGLLVAAALAFGCGNADAGPEPENTEQESMDGTGILQGNLMTAAEDTQGRAEPDEKADVVMEFPAGSSFLVTGEENGWSRIFYQGQTLFVPHQDLTDASGDGGTELDEELRNSAEEGAAFISSLEKQRGAAQQARIWKIVIIVLVAAVFVTGLISTLKKDKVDKKGQKDRKQN